LLQQAIGFCWITLLPHAGQDLTHPPGGFTIAFMKNGRYLWMQDEASLLRNADGRPKESSASGTLQNASRRKSRQRKRARKRPRGSSWVGLVIATLHLVW
jgi:hypothetical protein